MTAYRLVFPDYFDNRAAEIEAKGYFADVTIEAGGLQYRPVFYDPTRLAQTIDDELRIGTPANTEPNVVVVKRITRLDIELAVAHLADADFADLSPG